MAVTVFERAPEICEVGAGLSLWSNAVTALRRLGLESQITELGSPVARMQIVTASGHFECDHKPQSGGGGTPPVGVGRALAGIRVSARTRKSQNVRIVISWSWRVRVPRKDVVPATAS